MPREITTAIALEPFFLRYLLCLRKLLKAMRDVDHIREGGIVFLGKLVLLRVPRVLYVVLLNKLIVPVYHDGIL